jgi:hypothetical protein
LCVDPDTVPAQSFCAEISFISESFRCVGWRCYFALGAFALALIYTERKENNEF